MCTYLKFVEWFLLAVIASHSPLHLFGWSSGLTEFARMYFHCKFRLVLLNLELFNQAKEDACFVSMDFNTDMEICQKKGKANTISRNYVLPDYTHIKRGYLKVSEC